MRDHNSQVEFYSMLMLALHADIAERHGVLNTPCFKKEVRKLTSRLKHEGLSFLTKTLPSIGKRLDKSLATGLPFDSTGLRLQPSTTTPLLLGWLFEKVYLPDGSLRDRVVDIDSMRDSIAQAVQALRQFFYLFYKLELPHDEKTTRQFLDGFVEVDSSLGILADAELDKLPMVMSAQRVVRRTFAGFDHLDITPGHGPGAVATGEDIHDKSNFSCIYADIERVYPFTEYFMLSVSHIADQYHWLQGLQEIPPGAGTAKVVLVPKDSRGPRLISCEPLSYQWIQQGLGRKIQTMLEQSPVTSGHVNFTRQEINQGLALQASYDREWVTLDMKEASDRVSTVLVETLFSGLPVLDALLACRTHSTLLPDGRIVRMNKFAPMGSALCFPIESFVFYALCVGVLQAHGCYASREARSRVYVYGDDLVVRREDYALILRHLPDVGLMFNVGKCCTEGFFRESCGMDAYLGIPVTPVKLRTVWSSYRRNPNTLASYVAYANSFEVKGYMRVRNLIVDRLDQQYGKLPRAPIGTPGLFIWTGRLVNYPREGFRTRMNKCTHRHEVYGYVIKPVKRWKRFDSYRELLRRLLKPEQEPVIGTRALPKRSVLRRGWIPTN